MQRKRRTGALAFIDAEAEVDDDDDEDEDEGEHMDSECTVFRILAYSRYSSTATRTMFRLPMPHRLYFRYFYSISTAQARRHCALSVLVRVCTRAQPTPGLPHSPQLAFELSSSLRPSQLARRSGQITVTLRRRPGSSRQSYCNSSFDRCDVASASVSQSFDTTATCVATLQNGVSSFLIVHCTSPCRQLRRHFLV